MAIGAIMHKPGALTGHFNSKAPPRIGMGRTRGKFAPMPFTPQRR